MGGSGWIGENMWVTQNELILWMGNYTPQEYTVCGLFLQKNILGLHALLKHTLITFGEKNQLRV